MWNKSLKNRILELETEIEGLKNRLYSLHDDTLDFVDQELKRLTAPHEHPDYENKPDLQLTQRVTKLEQNSNRLPPHSHPERDLPPSLLPKTQESTNEVEFNGVKGRIFPAQRRVDQNDD